jgi:hypothetical protein
MIIGIVVLAVSIIASLVWLWAGGIDYMKENHPDYKGEDLFGD